MKKSIALLLILSLIFSLVACGGGDGETNTSPSSLSASVSDSKTEDADAQKPTDTDEKPDPKPEEEVRKPTPGQLPTETSNLVLAGDQARKRVIVYDADCYDGKNLEKCVVWSHTPDGAGIIAGLRYRSDTVFGNVILICGGGRFASIVTYNDAKTLWKTKNAGSNPHSVEILPDGNVVVGSSTDGKITLFHTSVLVEKPNTASADITYQTYKLDGAHGVLWDPEYQVLWALGNTELIAFRVQGSGENAVLVPEPSMKAKLPTNYGHALAADLTDVHALYLSSGYNVYRYDKKTKLFSDSYEGAVFMNRPNIKGFGNNPNGHFFYTYPNGGPGRKWASLNIAEWCTDTICYAYREENGTLKWKAMVSPSAAFYKVVPFYGEYQ